MKNCCLLSLAGLLLLPTVTKAEIDWIIDIMPASILAGFEADAFVVEGDGTREATSLITPIPGAAIGLAFTRPSGYITVKAGAAPILNANVRGFMYNATLASLFEIKRSIMMGPHIGLTHFPGPEWYGNGDVDFSDHTGFLAGLVTTMGDKISYYLAIDYIQADFDVERVAPGFSIKDNLTELDLSGLAVRFGLRAQF